MIFNIRKSFVNWKLLFDFYKGALKAGYHNLGFWNNIGLMEIIVVLFSKSVPSAERHAHGKMRGRQVRKDPIPDPW